MYKNIFNFILVMTLVSLSSLGAKETIKGSLSLESDTFHTTGNKTNKQNKTFFSEKLSLKYLNHNQDYDYGFIMNAKSYDDKYGSSHTTKLNKLRMFYKTKDFNLELGDVSNTLNSYVYSGSLKGFKVNKFIGKKRYKGLNLFLISGYKIGDWNDVFSSHDENAKGVAAELKYFFNRYQYIALSASSSDISKDGKKSDIIGLQSRWRFNRKATLKAQMAFANIRPDNDANSSYEKAIKVQLELKPKRGLKTTLKYERADSDYSTVFGYASKDKEKIQGDVSWKITKKANLKVMLKNTRDNLDGELGDTKYKFYTTTSLQAKPDFLGKGSSIGVTVKSKDINGRGQNKLTLTQAVNINKRLNKNMSISSSYIHHTDKDNNRHEYTLKSNNIKLQWNFNQKIDKTSSFDIAFGINSGEYKYQTHQKRRSGFKLSGKYKFNKSFDTKFLCSTKSSNDDIDDSRLSHYVFALSGTYNLPTKVRQRLNFLLEKRIYDTSIDANNYKQYRAKLTYKLDF